jgi:hypothetical protein
MRGAVVLAGRAISVPFRARRHRSATVNHGHSRSSDLQAPYHRCAATRMVRMGSLGRTARATSGATSGPPITGSQRTTTVTTGSPSAQLTGTFPTTAGRRDPPRIPDTEEDGGSTPPAPTTPRLSRASADLFVPSMDGDWQREVANGRETVKLFNQGVHLRPQLSAGRSHQPGCRSRSTLPGSPWVSPTRHL